MEDFSLTATRPRILVAEDHSAVAEGVRAILQKCCEVIGIVSDGQQLLAAAPRLNPDIIVLDISMPLLNGLDAARQLKPLLTNTKFIFLTMNDDSNIASAALNLGTVGYVLKHSAASELPKAISELLQGRSYVTPKLRPERASFKSIDVQQIPRSLTPSQQRLLQFFVEGRTAKEIANILGVSEKVVLFHKNHIMQSFNLRNDSELATFGRKRT